MRHTKVSTQCNAIDSHGASSETKSAVLRGKFAEAVPSLQHKSLTMSSRTLTSTHTSNGLSPKTVTFR